MVRTKYETKTRPERLPESARYRFEKKICYQLSGNVFKMFARCRTVTSVDALTNSRSYVR